jgi:hypothetical protein
MPTRKFVSDQNSPKKWAKSPHSAANTEYLDSYIQAKATELSHKHGTDALHQAAHELEIAIETGFREETLFLRQVVLTLSKNQDTPAETMTGQIAQKSA